MTVSFFRRYLLPGFVFQSVVIGGGYATGRELIEFFAPAGPVGGVLGLLVAGVVFGAVLAVGFELARVSRAYDYRHFCRALLGRGWVLFEILYILQLLLVLSVIGSASGQLMAVTFGLPPLAGTLGLMALIGLLTFNGSEAIKRFLAGWSMLLYAVYLTLFVLAFRQFGGDISNVYTHAGVGDGWLAGGVLYSGYNLAVLPAVLFVIAQHRRRRETVGAGLIAGVIGIVPGVLFFIAMMGLYPQIEQQPVPATFLLAALNVGWLALVFQIVVFGTFVETGAAMLHAVNQRLDATFRERGTGLPRLARPAVAMAFLAMAIFAAQTIGIVDLIAKGYGMLTLAFIVVLILPLMTVGVWKIPRRQAVPRPVGS